MFLNIKRDISFNEMTCFLPVVVYLVCCLSVANVDILHFRLKALNILDIYFMVCFPLNSDMYILHSDLVRGNRLAKDHLRQNILA